MKGAGRFRELLFVVDTCQGGTLSKDFRTDGVLAVGSRYVQSLYIRINCIRKCIGIRQIKDTQVARDPLPLSL